MRLPKKLREIDTDQEWEVENQFGTNAAGTPKLVIRRIELDPRGSFPRTLRGDNGKLYEVISGGRLLDSADYWDIRLKRILDINPMTEILPGDAVSIDYSVDQQVVHRLDGDKVFFNCGLTAGWVYKKDITEIIRNGALIWKKY